MKATVLALRLSVIGSFLCFFVWVVYPFTGIQMSEDQAALHQWNGYSAVLESDWLLMAFSLLAVARLLSCVGIWLGKRWGSRLFLVQCLISVGMVSMSGISIQMPSEDVLSYSSALLDGALAVFALLDPRFSHAMNQAATK